MDSPASLFPMNGTEDDLRHWLYNTLLTTPSNPPDPEQLRHDLTKIDVTPYLFHQCSLKTATLLLNNEQYAAYSLVMLPTTPQISNHQDEAWEIVVSFHRSDIVI